MTAIRFATSTVLGLLAATSAFAAEPDNASIPAPVAATAATTTSIAAAPAAQAARTRNTRYCIRSEAVTGSRLRRMDCRTRGTWNAMGVDVDAMLAASGR